MSTNNKLNILSIFEQSFLYCKRSQKSMIYFSFANFIFMALGLLLVGSLSSPFFLLWVAIYYVFWGYFFRYIFNRKPYYQSKVLADSLVPSTKIFFLTIITMIFFLALPLLPLYVALPFNLSVHFLEFMDKYSDFLQKNMEDSGVLDLFLSFVFIFLSPIIFYRPFYAWVSAIIGRSGSIKTAFSKTKNNYWQFFKVGIIMNASLILIKNLSYSIGSSLAFGNANVEYYSSLLILFALLSPLIIYFNIFVAKSYEFFFLD